MKLKSEEIIKRKFNVKNFLIQIQNNMNNMIMFATRIIGCEIIL